MDDDPFPKTPPVLLPDSMRRATLLRLLSLEALSAPATTTVDDVSPAGEMVSGSICLLAVEYVINVVVAVAAKIIDTGTEKATEIINYSS